VLLLIINVYWSIHDAHHLTASVRDVIFSRLNDSLRPYFATDRHVQNLKRTVTNWLSKNELIQRKRALLVQPAESLKSPGDDSANMLYQQNLMTQ